MTSPMMTRPPRVPECAHPDHRHSADGGRTPGKAPMSTFWKIYTAVVTVLVIAGTVEGVILWQRAHAPDLAARKAALTTQYEQAVAIGAKGSRPAACHDVDDATLQRLAGEVINEQLEKGATP